MPETSEATRVKNIGKRGEQVLGFLEEVEKAKLTQICEHLQLTKPQTLTVMQALEMDKKIFCRAGYWRLKQCAPREKNN